MGIESGSGGVGAAQEAQMEDRGRKVLPVVEEAL